MGESELKLVLQKYLVMAVARVGWLLSLSCGRSFFFK
jgi:hypothetical protein